VAVDSGALLYVLIGLVVLLVAGGALLLRRSSGRAVEAPKRPPIASGTGAPDDDDRSATGSTATGTEVLERPVDDAVVVEEPEAPALEVPEPSAGRLSRLKARLARSNTAVGKGLLALLTRDKLDQDTWDEVEETLLAADLGVAPTQELIAALQRRTRAESITDAAGARTILREELLALVDPSLDRSVATHVDEDRPAVVLVVGVNGTGKTTTTGKLARVLVADGRSVVLGAADTFRAAASLQLQTWGDRVGAAVVTGPENADPAAVAFDAVKYAVDEGADVVVVDTAGRLHTKTGLMDELGKVKRVVEKQAPVDEVLLVLDATTGQNGLRQAQMFSEVVDVTGIVLTKLDGTAKGGIVVAVQRELGVPVKLVGLGEGPDDLAPFDAEAFVDALLD
jgi:fused signal recognition particle receptor